MSHEVEIALLGPVEVRGARRPFARAWALDLVVYLAMHPRGASNEAWATALWPDRVMAAPTLHSIASAARRSLGRAADGSDLLPRAHGALRLSPRVATDWGRLVEGARRREPAGWDDALGLVRGRPFEGLRRADWTVFDGIAAEVEDTIVELAGRVAEQRLGVGDGRGAARAARRGLLASPFDERLYRLLLRAADAEGNPAGVESVMTELLRLLGDAHPQTADLYLALTRRVPAAGRPLARL